MKGEISLAACVHACGELEKSSPVLISRRLSPTRSHLKHRAVRQTDWLSSNKETRQFQYNNTSRACLHFLHF